jgi:hypothetical protein
MSDDEVRREKSAPQADLPLNFCPVCSARLESRHCKMVCARCGYFMSCSEFE